MRGLLASLGVVALVGCGTSTAEETTGLDQFTMSAPPAPTLTASPSSVTTATTATFAFLSQGAVSFTCSLDGGSAQACASPKAYSSLALGAHSFAVRAFNRKGVASAATAYSWTIQSQQPPALPSVPTGLAVVSGSGSVALSWSPNPTAEQVDGYQVYRDSVLVADGLLATSYTDTGLTNGTTYGYRISAHNAAGYGDWTAAVSATPSGPPASCAVDPATMTAPGCTLLREDTSLVPNPEPGLWGHIECAVPTRYQHVTIGGDSHPRWNGSAQGDSSFRKMTVLDGDDFYGERCQLARNDWTNGENTGTQTSGTFALFYEGERKITFFSLRQAAGFDPNVNAWQQIYNSKQAQPYTNHPQSGNAIEMQIYGGMLRLMAFWDQPAGDWVTPAPANDVWVRYALDVVYSANPALGRVKVYVDKNGDGDALDSGEQSPELTNLTTLATRGTAEYGFPVGSSIPSHLRMGLYHNPTIACPAPTGCQVDLDNVQVVRP